MRKYYALVLANITRGNFLKHMVNTLAEGNIQLVEVEPEVKEELASQVEKSVYAIC